VIGKNSEARTEEPEISRHKIVPVDLIRFAELIG
jgi:hypothetical protein